MKNNFFKEFEKIDQRESQKTFNKGGNEMRLSEMPFYSPEKINLVGYTGSRVKEADYVVKEVSLKESSLMNKESQENDFEYSKEEDFESKLRKSSCYKGIRKLIIFEDRVILTKKNSLNSSLSKPSFKKNLQNKYVKLQLIESLKIPVEKGNNFFKFSSLF